MVRASRHPNHKGVASSSSPSYGASRLATSILNHTVRGTFDVFSVFTSNTVSVIVILPWLELQSQNVSR